MVLYYYQNNHSNIITLNSKLSNFTMHQGAQFTNTSGSLTITETNTFLNTDLTLTNNLTVNNISSFNDDIICGSSSSNLITFNSKII